MSAGDEQVAAIKAEEAIYHRKQVEWLEQHTKGADLLECNTRTGVCERAVYFSPLKKLQDFRDEHLRNFFREVAEAEERERRERLDAENRSKS